MMETLYILRHAKSAQAKKGQEDFDRPLNQRGREAAKKIGRYMKKAKLAPSLVLCSPSARARETLMLARKASNIRFWTEYVPELYLADIETLTGLVEASEAETLMLVGHNPGLHELALALIEDGPAGELEALRGKFPTGGLVEIDLVKNALVRFVRPKSLPPAR